MPDDRRARTRLARRPQGERPHCPGEQTHPVLYVSLHASHAATLAGVFSRNVVPELLFRQQRGDDVVVAVPGGVTVRAGLGRGRRNRGAPIPRSAPPARTRAPTYPGHTAASPRRPAPAQAPRADRPSRPTATARAQRPAPRARPAPPRDWGPPPGPVLAPPGQRRTRAPARAP